MISRNSLVPNCQPDEGLDALRSGAGAAADGVGAGTASSMGAAVSPRSMKAFCDQERIKACSRPSCNSGLPEPDSTRSSASFFLAAVRPA